MWNSNISQKGRWTNASKVKFLTSPFLIPLFIREDVPLCMVHDQGRCRSLVVIREGYDSWVFGSVYIHQDTSILSRGERKHFQCTGWILVTHGTISQFNQLYKLLTFSSSYWLWFLQTYVGTKHAHSRPTNNYQISTAQAYRSMFKQVLKVKDKVLYNMKTYQIF